MPPVSSRTPARGTPAWMATPIRRVARATPTRGSPVAIEDDCVICCMPLSAKRASTLRPCAHRFHDSCQRQWMETRTWRTDQTCPMCRTRSTAVVDERGRSAPPAFPYGDSGEPLKRHLMQHEQPANLEWLLRETNEQFGRCEELVKNEARGTEYTDDIKAEMDKLQIRRGVLSRMLQEVERGEWNVRVGPMRPRPALPVLDLLQLRHAQLLLQHAATRAAAQQVDSIYVHRPSRRTAAAAARLSRFSTDPRDAPRVQQPDPNDWSQSRPNTMQPTAAAAARQAAGAAERSMTAASRRQSVADVPPPQTRMQQRLLNNGATTFPVSRPTAAAAAVMGAATTVGPVVVGAVPRFQLQPSSAALARRAAEARQQAENAAAAAPAPAPPHVVNIIRPIQVTSVASTRPPRPQQQHAVRVSAAGAGPAARRRLSGQSSTPAGAPPARRPRHQQPAAEPRIVRVYINTTPSVSSEDEEEEVMLAPPAVNYHETPRRSERIATRRRLESGGQSTGF